MAIRFGENWQARAPKATDLEWWNKEQNGNDSKLGLVPEVSAIRGSKTLFLSTRQIKRGLSPISPDFS